MSTTSAPLPGASAPSEGLPVPVERHPDLPASTMEDRMIFLISTPRAGSTLLMRILNATDQIYSRPEPHLLTALAHLGYWQSVDKAPYDQLQSQQATRDFVRDLPQGEEDYYAACRLYTDHLYGRMLDSQGEGARYFLEKTPANALVLPFLEKLYPNARFIVLTRHPAAIFASYANSFFDGDFEAAVGFNPILSRYVPAMADFLRRRQVPTLHVSYEEVVSEPERTLARISQFLGIPYDAGALDYQRKDVAAGLGDPIAVSQHKRPVKTSIDKWAPELAADGKKFEVVAKQLAGVPPEDLETWGYPVDTLWEPLEAADPEAWKPKKRKWDRWALQRRALVLIRKDVHRRPHGALLKRIRFICDVLLRGEGAFE